MTIKLGRMVDQYALTLPLNTTSSTLGHVKNMTDSTSTDPITTKLGQMKDQFAQPYHTCHVTNTYGYISTFICPKTTNLAR